MISRMTAAGSSYNEPACRAQEIDEALPHVDSLVHHLAIERQGEWHGPVSSWRRRFMRRF